MAEADFSFAIHGRIFDLLPRVRWRALCPGAGIPAGVVHIKLNPCMLGSASEKSDSQPQISTPKSSDVAQSSDNHENDVIAAPVVPPPQLQDITFNNESIIAREVSTVEQSSRRVREVSELSGLSATSDSTKKVRFTILA